MVDLEFVDDPPAEAVETFLDRIQSTSTFPRGLTAGRVAEFDSEEETLRIDFDQLKRMLIEHQQYEQARGFSSTEVDILRVVEEGPDRMRFDEIRSAINEYHDERNQEEVADQTIHHHLRNLRDKGLIEHGHNSYTYVGSEDERLRAE